MKHDFLLLILFFMNKLFVLTSRIPVQPYYHDLTIVNEAIIVKLNYQMIRNEVQDLYKKFKTIDDDMFFQKLGQTRQDWSRLYLKWFEKIDPVGEKLCPKTTALMREMPNVKIAMFSVLKPGAKILPHRGPYRGCLRLHMGLITPNSDDCFINLDGKSYSWRDGEVVLLDDSYLHYVENNTNKYRVILFCDIVRPMNFMGDDLNKILIHMMGEYTHRYN
jgi:beta-hydroxylase